MKKTRPHSYSKLLERKALGNLRVPWHPTLGIKVPQTVPLRFLHTLHFPPTFAQPGALFLPLLLTLLPSSFSSARQNGDITATPSLFSLRKLLPVFREPMPKDLPSSASSPFLKCGQIKRSADTSSGSYLSNGGLWVGGRVLKRNMELQWLWRLFLADPLYWTI